MITTAVAIAGHLLGSGMLVGLWPALAALAAAGVAGWFLVPRRRGRAVVISSIALQLAMHVGFSASMATGKFSAMSMVLCGTPHLNLAPTGLTPTLVAGHGPSVLAVLLSRPALPMLAAHLVAAAISGLWMHSGERVVTALADAAAALRSGRILILLATPAESPVRQRSWDLHGGAGRSPRGRSVGAFGLRGPPPAYLT